MNVIDIGTVLNKLNDTVDEHDSTVKEYGIRVMTADGRLRTMRCRKNVKSPKQQLRSALDPRGKVMFNLKRNGTLLVQDLDLDEPRSPKVAFIYHFRDFNETTWSRVRH
jgi:hypothetical protein